ncbi:helix-turn-helix domain-containing protein [Saxibacter everestensis]|uniref:Helix-turn-helix domain-containing protein n=1 Tax=Saxibacter everestensis TaxID=2909229 RepID=A0ABY8QWT3_9MICO|nr:helix-turn-helix domain-containing protein [Brevibacteriaceae bacterium ZFBP1038]
MTARTTGKAAANKPTSTDETEALRLRAATGRRLKAGIGTLATATLQRLDATLPWYRAMQPADRSWVGLVAQAGISSFVEWYRKPAAPLWIVADIFRAAPRELTRAISLQQTLQLVRVVVEVVEERVPDLAKVDDEAALREAVLRFSREVAFAAADVYAQAAEARGSWDARLEALVVDSLVRGESVDALASRTSALGWRSQGEVAVVVGQAPFRPTPQLTDELRRAAQKVAEDALVGIHEDRLIVVLGGSSDFRKSAAALADRFGPTSVVLGPTVATLAEAGRSAAAAVAARKAVAAWPSAPRPVTADELWPERAMAGDLDAQAELINRIYRPLEALGGSLLETVTIYLDCGNSLEATAREMYVHPNTVRYRLRKATETVGWDPTAARESFVIRAALVYGRLAASTGLSTTSNSAS